MNVLPGCVVKPVPLTHQDVEQRIQDDLNTLTQFQDPVTGPISLYEAMARALKNNLTLRVEGLKKMVAHRQLDLDHFDLLPTLVTELGYNGRNNFNGAKSRSLLSGETSLEPSTSSDKNLLTANLTLSWDVLDFGLSYVRAEQAANDVLIAEEEKRRMANRVIQDVRMAFSRAVGAERVMGRLEFLDDWVTQALSEVQAIRTKHLRNPLDSLNYERDLLGLQRDIHQLKQELSLARIQLAELMNLPPGEPFELLIPARKATWNRVEDPLSDLEYHALRNRPELRKVDYQKRINAKETKAALLELLPNLNVFAGGHYDSNSFLFHNNWLNYGAKVSWNLLNVFRHPTRLQVIDAQDHVLRAQSLALTMTIMTQVHVAVAQYHAAKEDMDMAVQYFHTQASITKQVHQSWKFQRMTDHLLIKEKVQRILAELRMESSLASLEEAYANLLAAIGENPFPRDVSGRDLQELTAALEHYWVESDAPLPESQERHVPVLSSHTLEQVTQ